MTFRVFAVFGALCLLLFCVSEAKSDPIDYTVLNIDDNELIPALSHVDSLIKSYRYTDASAALRELLNEVRGDDSAASFKAAVLLLRQGYSFLRDGYYDSSGICFEAATDKITKANIRDRRLNAALLFFKGELAQMLRDDDYSLRLFNQLLKSVSPAQPEDKDILLRVLHRLCQVHIYNDDADSAQEFLNAAAQIIDRVDTIHPLHLFEQNYFWGDIYAMRGQLDSADIAFSNAQAIARKNNYPVKEADCLQDWSYTFMYRYQIAVYDSMTAQSLEMVESILRPDNPELGKYLNSRADCLGMLESQAEALNLLDRCEEILEKSVGTLHPEYALMVSYKTSIYQQMRNYSKAIEYNEKEIELSRAVHGENSPQYITAIGNKAVISMALFDYDSAIPALKEMCEYYRQSEGESSLYYLNYIGYLGYAYYLAGKYSSADSLYTDILPRVKQAFGEDNEKTGETYMLSGMNKYALGSYAEAEIALLHALDLYLKNKVSHSPDISGLYSYLATLYGSMGKYETSLNYYKKLLANRRKFLSASYSYSTADQKLRYLATHPILMHSLYSMAMKSGLADAKEFAFEMLLRGKAIALESIISENQLARCTMDEELRAIYQALGEKSEEIANLTFSLQGADDVQAHQQILDSLFSERHRLESELSSRCDVAAQEIFNRSITKQDVLAKLPDDAVLIDFAVYEPYDFDRADASYLLFGESHYLAIVLTKRGEPALYDLGTIKEIDSLVQKTRVLIDQVPSGIYSDKGVALEARFTAIASELFTRIIGPYYKAISPARHWIISCDGGLNLLPFEALVLPQGKYVIEDHVVSYVSSSRDLLQYSVEDQTHPNSMALYYSPQYDVEPAELASASSDNVKQSFESDGDDFAVAFRDDGECLDAPFAALSSTDEEATEIINGIGDLLPGGIQRFTGGQATENSVKLQIQRSEIYHFATHGFVCPDLHVQDFDNYHCFMLYSGLALAGANARFNSSTSGKPSLNDGILTAYEISALDFEGVDLVTLSACETGLGETIDAEGVFGLRRAFQQAGAQSLLMSLRKVPDKQCARLMSEFYRHWLRDGKPKGIALHEATLGLLRQSREAMGNSHPFFWSGFILFGNPY
ncbi:MAG: CHAT domain-containing tetratricopeptide repeat protein [Candidatus Zixiibacteriota bacterium]